MLQYKLKSVVVKCLFSWYCRGVPSLLILVLTLDVYASQINSQTIDLYLDGKIPKFNIRVDNCRKFHSILLCPFGKLLFVRMRNPGIF